ncbi:MAG: MerR family transcriptional regulator [Sphaerochaetaceae bacterium]
MQTYRIGELARYANVTVRTVRYYEDLGLLKTQGRSEGGQRTYTDRDLVYLKRILELKELDFSLEEIKTIISLGPGDSDGSKRREELLRQYRYKLSEAMAKQAVLEKRIDDLSWHIRQLQSDMDWQQCPGSGCQECSFRQKCRFAKQTDSI